MHKCEHLLSQVVVGDKIDRVEKGHVIPDLVVYEVDPTDHDGCYFSAIGYGPVTNEFVRPHRKNIHPAEHGGSPRFLALCDEMKAVHQKKGADYGSDKDIFENIRRSERIGIPASKGCWMRASDKVGRLDKFFSGKALLNESAYDSLVDLANYCLIAAVLLEEEAKKGTDGSN